MTKTSRPPSPAVQLSNGDTLEADAYVSALPFENLMPLLPPPLAEDPFFADLPHLRTAPIVNVYLWYDRPVMEQDFVALIDSPLQWVFNKTAIMGVNGSDKRTIRHHLPQRRLRLRQPAQAGRPADVHGSHEGSLSESKIRPRYPRPRRQTGKSHLPLPSRLRPLPTHMPTPPSTTSSSPATGPTLAGLQPWRELSEAASTPPQAVLTRKFQN